MKKFRDFIIEDHDGSGAAGLSSTPKPYDLDSAEVKAKINLQNQEHILLGSLDMVTSLVSQWIHHSMSSKLKLKP